MDNSIKKSVFISHASKNFKLADDICSLIENRGISCWIAPRDIPPGASYGEEIARAIEQCSAVIFVMTEEANQSRAIANELELAFRHQRLIIPVRLNNIEPAQSLKFYVSNAQWVDAIYSPLKKRVDVLVNIINAATNNTPIPSPVAENKTLLGAIERRLEGLVRYKILSLLVAFTLAILTGAISLMFSSRTMNHLEEEKSLIQLDPTTFGLVTLNTFDENIDTCKPKESKIRASIYVNLRDPQKAAFELSSRVFSPNGTASKIDLSEIKPFKAAGAQTTFICLPPGSTRISFCMSAQHPNLSGRYAAKWTYQIQRNKGETVIVRELDPKMYEAEQSSCDVNQF